MLLDVIYLDGIYIRIEFILIGNCINIITFIHMYLLMRAWVEVGLVMCYMYLLMRARVEVGLVMCYMYLLMRARMEVGLVLCYMVYDQCTGGGGLFMFCVIWCMMSARVEVGYLCSVLYVV